MNLELRRATPQDAIPAAELIALSMGEYGDHALGFGDHQYALSLVRKLFALKGNRFSFDSTTLATLDGTVAGLLLAFPGNQYFIRNLKLAGQIPGILGLKDSLRLGLHSIAAAMGKETDADEYYIAQVATHPDFQRQGIGQKLMTQAEDLAKKALLHKVSLVVELDNEPACALYRKIGFTIAETIHTPGLAARLHTWGYHRMVKEI